MSIFVRKIDKAKWLQVEPHSNADPSADAITNCLKTKQNTLSVWEIESEAEADIDEAILAIVSGQDFLETIDVILMSSEYIKTQGINCVKSSGFTPVVDLVEKHTDLSNLTYKSLGIVAYHIAEKIKRYTKSQLKDILMQAIEQERLNPETLKDSIKEKLNK